MTLEEYKSGLYGFDWYYDYSDDHSVWTRARARKSELEAAQKILDPDRKIWEEIRDSRMK